VEKAVGGGRVGEGAHLCVFAGADEAPLRQLCTPRNDLRFPAFSFELGGFPAK